MNNIRKDYTHIAIIGNGFDLNLGLKTSYTDFITSNEFVNLLNKSNYLADYLSNKHHLQKWIDIENELKSYSNSQNITEAIYNFEKDFLEITNALKEYLKKIKYDNLDKTAHSYQLIKQLINSDFLILDFNYTKTTECILMNLGIDENSINERLIKVHGSLEEKEIIFGVEDGANIKLQHVFLRKAYNQSFKAINVKENLDTISELFIFGHSLGETDHMYFNSFFETFSHPSYPAKMQKIYLYYFGQESYKQLFMQLDTLTSRHLTILKQKSILITIDTSKK